MRKKSEKKKMIGYGIKLTALGGIILYEINENSINNIAHMTPACAKLIKAYLDNAIINVEKLYGEIKLPYSIQKEMENNIKMQDKFTEDLIFGKNMDDV